MNRWIEVRRRSEFESVKFAAYKMADALIIFFYTYTLVFHYPQWLVDRNTRAWLKQRDSKRNSD